MIASMERFFREMYGKIDYFEIYTKERFHGVQVTNLSILSEKVTILRPEDSTLANIKIPIIPAVIPPILQWLPTPSSLIFTFLLLMMSPRIFR